MTLTAPLDVLSPERAHHVADGLRSAAEVIATVLPPRTEDPDGALTLPTLELLAQRRLRAELALRSGTTYRRWWLEGFLLGFVREASRVLTLASDLCDYTPQDRLTDMADHVLERVTADQRAASALAFDLCTAVLDDDGVGLSWCLESLWHSADFYRRTLVAAINTACAAWRLLQLLEETADQ